MSPHPRSRSLWFVLSVGLIAALLFSACGPANAPGAAPTAASGGGPTKHVSIINQDLTDEQIKAKIQEEGSLVVGNWTYTANDELVKQFTQYVKTTYGVDIEF